MSETPDRCPNCGGRFPFRYGPHPTWIPCDRYLTSPCLESDHEECRDLLSCQCDCHANDALSNHFDRRRSL